MKCEVKINDECLQTTPNFNICRICENRKDLSSIFRPTSFTSIFISKAIMKLTRVKISRDDGLPTLICSACIERLENAYSFKLQCETTDVKLRNCSSNAGHDDDRSGFDMSRVKHEDFHAGDEFMEDDTNASIVNMNTYNDEDVGFDDDKPLSFHKSGMSKDMNLKNAAPKKPGRKKYTEEVKCDICSKQFRSQWQLNRHQIWHSDEKPYKCGQCEKSYRVLFLLTEHKRVHTGEKPYVCNFCGKTFSSRNIFESHKQSHADKNLACHVCDAKFRRKDTLKKHLCVHGDTKKYICSDCGRTFNQFGNMKVHMRIHTGEKPFPCVYCGKAFAQASQMRVHIRIHTGERPFVCNDCGKDFRKAGSLKEHMNVHIKDSNEFKCALCEKGFKSSYLMKKHARRHRLEKDHPCTVCHKEFSIKSDLIRHSKVHSSDKKFRQAVSTI